MNDRLIGPAIGVGATGAAALMDLNFAGIMAGLGVLGTGGLALWYQYNQTKLKIYREFEAGKLEVQKLQEDANKASLAAKVRELETKLDQKRKQWHEEANRQGGLFMKVQAELRLAELRVAKLEGQLGAIDRSHAENINANTKNIDVVAERAGVQPPEHPPPVEPIVPAPPDDNHDVLDPSDDDLSAFLRP